MLIKRKVVDEANAVYGSGYQRHFGLGPVLGGLQSLRISDGHIIYGKTLRQRAKALIEIAHPDHRAELERQAFERFKTLE